MWSSTSRDLFFFGRGYENRDDEDLPYGLHDKSHNDCELLFTGNAFWTMLKLSAYAIDVDDDKVEKLLIAFLVSNSVSRASKC